MAAKTPTTVTFMEVTIRGYELRTIGKDRAECIATLEAEIGSGWAGECLGAWAEDNPELIEGHPSPLEAWIDYAGSVCQTLTAGTVTYP